MNYKRIRGKGGANVSLASWFWSLAHYMINISVQKQNNWFITVKPQRCQCGGERSPSSDCSTACRVCEPHVILLCWLSCCSTCRSGVWHRRGSGRGTDPTAQHHLRCGRGVTGHWGISGCQQRLMRCGRPLAAGSPKDLHSGWAGTTIKENVCLLLPWKARAHAQHNTCNKIIGIETLSDKSLKFTIYSLNISKNGLTFSLNHCIVLYNTWTTLNIKS